MQVSHDLFLPFCFHHCYISCCHSLIFSSFGIPDEILPKIYSSSDPEAYGKIVSNVFTLLVGFVYIGFICLLLSILSAGGWPSQGCAYLWGECSHGISVLS